MSSKFRGFVNGIASSASFGLIPLFALPLLQSGMQFLSVIVYRFSFAALALGVILLIQHQSLRISRSDFFPLLMLSLLYLMSGVFLLWGYNFMSSGIATTIHFMYPVITTLIMMIFYHEKKSFWRMAAVLMAILGVYFLSNTSGGQAFNWAGVFIVLLSGVAYALYLVALGQMKRLKVKGIKLTFYVFFLGSIILAVSMTAFHHIEPIASPSALINLLLLALIPTVVSNLTLVESIKYIGSTLTSVLGAMEPVTAVLVGILVFHEAFTLSIALGICLIISAVSIIILKR